MTHLQVPTAWHSTGNTGLSHLELMTKCTKSRQLSGNCKTCLQAWKECCQMKKKYCIIFANDKNEVKAVMRNIPPRDNFMGSQRLSLLMPLSLGGSTEDVDKSSKGQAPLS